MRSIARFSEATYCRMMMSKGGFKGRTQTKSLDLEGAVCWVPLMRAPFQSPLHNRQPYVSFIKSLCTTDSNAFSTAASVSYYILLSVTPAAGIGDICERRLSTEETRVNKCMLCSWDFQSKCVFVQHCSSMHSKLKKKTTICFFKSMNCYCFYLFNSQSPYR